jgi:formylmethanofuran dehydrogenase subunit E
MNRFRITILALLSCVLLSAPATCETSAQWIELGARVHGAFGAFIPVGIRIGLDARERLKTDPRGLAVVYYGGEKPPCPCVADGVMLATGASPDQGTLQISSEKAPPGLMAVIVIRNRKTGEGLKYTIADEWLPKILSWNKSDPAGRYDSAMSAEGLFTSEAVAP